MVLMLLNETKRALLVFFCISFFYPCRPGAQGFLSDWPAIHKKDLSKWTAKTGLSFETLDKLTKVARQDDAAEEEEGYFSYIIENIDTRNLHVRDQILVSTWEPGTGHCMTLYVLKRMGSRFQKVWQSTENLCTESVLGAAISQATPTGRIIVRFREHSFATFDPEKDEAPTILKVEITYKWNGSTYVNASRSELPEPATGP